MPTSNAAPTGVATPNMIDPARPGASDTQADTASLRHPRRLLVQRLPVAMRVAILVVAIVSATGLAVLTGDAQGVPIRLAVIMSLPVGATVGFLFALLLLLLPEWRSARDRRWLIDCMSDVSKVDREQRFSALLMQDTDHELHGLAHAIHGALLSAHRDRLEAAHLRRELDARVQRQTKAVVAQWQKLSNTDELTGLCNRRGFDLAFADLFRAAAEDGDELALLAVDMDYFKQLNDACGHSTGDAALKAAGEVLRSQLRNGDVAGRVGGDEFLVALRGTGPRDAMIVAQRLMDLYAKTPAAVGLPVRWPTFSIGIACAGEHRAVDASQLKDMADQALYAVKRSGRAGARAWKPGEAAAPPPQASAANSSANSSARAA